MLLSTQSRNQDVELVLCNLFILYKINGDNTFLEIGAKYINYLFSTDQNIGII